MREQMQENMLKYVCLLSKQDTEAPHDVHIHTNCFILVMAMVDPEHNLGTLATRHEYSLDEIHTQLHLDAN